MTTPHLSSALLIGGALTLVGCGEKKPPAVAAAPGTSVETGLKVCGPEGQRAYLAQLTCPGTDPVGEAVMAGAQGPVADGHMVDHVQITCPDGSSHELFMDLYHCDDSDPLQAIGALGLLPPPPVPEIELWEPGPQGIPLDLVARIPDEGVLLEVTNTGAKPRQALRYHPQVGQKESVRMRMLMAMEMSIAGESAGRMALPAMILDMEMEVTEVAGREIQYNAAVTQATVDRNTDTAGFPPQVLVELETSLQPLEGMRGYARITDRGESLKADFQLPPDAPPDLAKQMASFSDSAENLAAPVPKEAVGVGATWSVFSKLDSSGFKIVQRADYLLADIQDNVVTLEVAISQQPLEANPQMDSLPPGAEMEMVRFTSDGTGQSVLDLGHLVPSASLATVDMDFAFKILSEGQQIDAEMAMSMTMQLEGSD